MAFAKPSSAQLGALFLTVGWAVSAYGQGLAPTPAQRPLQTPAALPLPSLVIAPSAQAWQDAPTPRPQTIGARPPEIRQGSQAATADRATIETSAPKPFAPVPLSRQSSPGGFIQLPDGPPVLQSLQSGQETGQARANQIQTGDGIPVSLPRPAALTPAVVLADLPRPAQATGNARQIAPAPYAALDQAISPGLARRIAQISKVQSLPPVDAGCAARLASQGVQFTPIPNEVRNACVVIGAVKVQAFGGVTLKPNQSEMTCNVAERASDWITNGVQTAAFRHFRQRVVALRHFSAYSCRQRGGGKISEHGFANALDIAVFELEDGRKITVEDHWRGDGSAFGAAASAFLREVNRTACDHFMLVLNPNSDADHYNHFHFDAGPWKHCD